MLPYEKEAILNYVDSRLVDLCKVVEKDLPPDAIPALYDSVYTLIQDLEHTFQGAVQMEIVERMLPSPKNKL